MKTAQWIDRGIAAILVIALLVWIIGGIVAPTPVSLPPADPALVAELTATKNEVVTLKQLMSKQSDDLQLMSAAVAKLNIKPTEIHTIYHETVTLQGNTETTSTLPASHQYLLNHQIPVAEFVSDTNGYHFNTYDLTFKNDIVIAQKQTVTHLTVTSSANPDTAYEVAADTHTTYITPPRKMFEPNLYVGGSASWPPTLDASLGVTFLHPAKNLDVLGLRISGTRNSVGAGIDAIGYNIGGPLPVLTDIWVLGGATLTDHLLVEPTITIGSKF